MNDRVSVNYKSIEIKFNIPEDQDLCEMDEEGLECVPRPGYNKAMHQKFIVMLQNRKIFVADEY